MTFLLLSNTVSAQNSYRIFDLGLFIQSLKINCYKIIFFLDTFFIIVIHQLFLALLFSALLS